MPRVRPSAVAARHATLANAALIWAPAKEPTALSGYAVKHGVRHLLALRRTDDAAERMIDLRFMAAMLGAYPTFVEPLRHWRAIGLERAESGYQRVAEGQPAADREAAPDDALMKAASEVVVFLSDAGLYRAAELLAPWILAAHERALGPEHPDTVASVKILARLLQAQGRLAEAAPLSRRALEASAQTLGVDHPATLSCANDLGVLLTLQGSDHRRLLRSANDPVTVLTLQGELVAAEAFLRSNLEACERALDDDHPITLASVNNLAIALERQGAPVDGATAKFNSLAEVDSLLETISTIRRRRPGLDAEAGPLYRRALETRERTLGPEHPDTLAAMNGLATLLLRQQKFAEAEPLLHRALEVQERTLGHEHPGTLAAMHNLAVLLTRGSFYGWSGRRWGAWMAAKNWMAAEKLYERAYKGRERTLGSEHPDTLISGRKYFTTKFGRWAAIVGLVLSPFILLSMVALAFLLAGLMLWAGRFVLG